MFVDILEHPGRKIPLCLAAVSACLVATFTTPTQAAADLYDDVETASLAADEAKNAYDQVVEKYENTRQALKEAKAHSEETSAALSAEREEAGKSARYLYMTESRPSSLIDSFLSAEDFSDIVICFDSLNRIYDYHQSELASLKVKNDEALKAQSELEKAEADEKEEKEKLEEQMGITLDAYHAAQDAVAEEEERQAAEEAARIEEERQAAEEEQQSQEEEETETDDEGETSEESEKQDSGNTSNTTSDDGILPSDTIISLDELMFMGVLYANGYRYTYYSESVLPGPGLAIPSRHNEDGFVVDAYGNICVASSDYPVGTIVPVPFAGRNGCVYDCGCASGTIDIYIE